MYGARIRLGDCGWCRISAHYRHLDAVQARCRAASSFYLSAYLLAWSDIPALFWAILRRSDEYLLHDLRLRVPGLADLAGFAIYTRVCIASFFDLASSTILSESRLGWVEGDGADEALHIFT